MSANAWVDMMRSGVVYKMRASIMAQNAFYQQSLTAPDHVTVDLALIRALIRIMRP